MKKITLFAIGICTIVVGAFQLLGGPQEPGREPPLKSFMLLKLEHAKGILGGLATEDFESIAKNAQALKGLSLESSWNRLTTTKYLQHSSDFRTALTTITEAAHEKNLDRAALGYVNLTLQCIECHRYLRHQ